MYGLVAQLVRAPPCHGGGHGFKSHPGRNNPCKGAIALLQFKVLFMDGFPSGQRGQTVNLLSSTSVVRIHPHPFFICLLWGLSSAGRAPALQAGGHRFEPCRPHLSTNIAGWSSPVARWAHNPEVDGSNPSPAMKRAEWLVF